MLGDKIKQLRENKNLGLNETAELVGISGSYLSNIESGKKKNPSMQVLSKIAVVLDVQVEDFFKESDTENSNTSEVTTSSPLHLTIKEQENLDEEAQEIVRNFAVSLSKNKEYLENEDYKILEASIRSSLEAIKLKNKEKYTPKKYKKK